MSTSQERTTSTSLAHKQPRKEIAMKGGQNLRDLQATKKQQEDERWVKPQPCLICGKIIEGAYAQHRDGWTCCRKCMLEQDKKPLYPSPSKEFLQQLEQQDDLDFDYPT